MTCKRHPHKTEEGAAKCRAKALQKRADAKLAKVFCQPPAQEPRHYEPAQKRRIGNLTVFVFSESYIIPNPYTL